MRLGADVVVFSRKAFGSLVTQTIGLLSYTYLRKTGQDDIIVPMVDFEKHDGRFQPLVHNSRDDWNNNLKTILDWSPFSAEDELFSQFDDIGPHGTKVIIYNLWLNEDGLLELDFDYDDEDVCLGDEGITGQKVHKEAAQSHFSYCYRYSLRAYASILYLKKFSNFQIILRGRAVDQLFIAKCLKFKKSVSYRPQLVMNSNHNEVKVTVGFLKEVPVIKTHGVNIYHKNRLIMPFLSVVSRGSSKGAGVVGVLEANFIEPAHDKQDFERTALFLRLHGKLRQMVIDYRKENLHHIERSVPRPEEAIEESPHVDYPENLPPIQNDGYREGIETSMIGACGPTQGQNPTDPLHVYNNSETENSFHSIKDKICEENLQLFIRCDTYRQEEARLKEIVERMERELKEAKRKCSDLALKVDTYKSRR